MFKLLDSSNLKQLKAFCHGSIIGTRISCYALCYGFERSFLTFWGEFKDESLLTVIALFDDSLTVLSSDATDYEELSDFLSVITWQSVTAAEGCLKALGYCNYTAKQGYRFNGDGSYCELCASPSEDDIHGIYSLISTMIPDSFSNQREAYLSFLSDFTFRKRRGYSRAVCIKHGDELASCAITAAENDCFALISGVACSEKFKRTGCGKKTVLSIIDLLEKDGKRCFVIALNENAEGFYEYIGFEKEERIATATRKVI